VKPVDAAGSLGDGLRNEIAAGDMREFVEKHSAKARLRPLPRAERHDRGLQRAARHRHGSAGAFENGDGAADSELSGQFSGSSGCVGRGLGAAPQPSSMHHTEHRPADCHGCTEQPERQPRQATHRVFPADDQSALRRPAGGRAGFAGRFGAQGS
jgi:hypothetical protein